MPLIAALVPTHDRPELLAQRALASIAHQTRTPDYLVIVDDSSPTCRPANQRVAADLRCPGTRVVYLENRRTPGLSGAVCQHGSRVVAGGSSVVIGRHAGRR